MNNIPDEDVVTELLTLTCEVDGNGDKRYLNKEGKYHRIYGPCIIGNDGYEVWCKNGKLHREDGPAHIWPGRAAAYYIDGNELEKDQFIQWQKDNGII